MLSYRHAFHAGNFADILKHLVLVNTLHYVIQKPAPLFYLDTHAGAGLYNLRDAQSRKTGEAEAGIMKLDPAVLLDRADANGKTALQNYFAAVQPYLDKQRYPGSPLLASNLLRRQDHLHLCDLHPADHADLLANTSRDKRIICEQEDGYKRALALLPPVQKRAVVLIDPSYELDEDYQKVVKTVSAIHERMPQAQILLWYPVVSRHETDRLLAAIQRREIKDLWQFELGIQADAPGKGMTANGMVAVNPPWTLPDQLRNVLPLLQEQLAGGWGNWKVVQLSKE